MHVLLTTEALPPLPVAERLGIVTAECAFGMNLFRDFFAGMRDVFGGRSSAVQNVLRDARNTVLDELRKEARRLGANGVIAVSLNYSEFSGQGKSMLFLVATGTAVRFERKSEVLEERKVSWRTIERELKRREIEERIKDLALNEEIRTQLVEYEVYDAAPIVLKKLKEYKGYKLDPWKPYFMSLPPETAAETLYPAAVEDDNRIAPFALRLLQEMKLLDYDRVIRFMQIDDEDVRRRALYLSTIHRPAYTPDDIEHLETLVNVVREAFPKRHRLIEEKGMFTSSAKQKWVCGVCERTNDIEMNFCSRCSRDIYGFLQSELHPLSVIELLENKAAALREAFGLPTSDVEMEEA